MDIPKSRTHTQTHTHPSRSGIFRQDTDLKYQPAIENLSVHRKIHVACIWRVHNTIWIIFRNAFSSLSLSFFFLWPHPKHMEVPRLGVELEQQLQAYTTACTWDEPVTYTLAYGNARSLTHWARPGIEPASSWIVVRFITCWATSGTPVSYLFQYVNIF